MEGLPRNSLPVSEQPEESSWAFLGIAWRRKWIVLLMVLVGAGLGYLRFRQSEPVYESVAQLLVVRNNSVLPVSGIKTDTRYDETLDAVFRSPRVIGKAVERLDLDRLPSLKNSGSPVNRIISGLESTVSEGRNGEIVQFSYRSQDRAECPQVLKAVLDVYVEFLGESRRSQYEDTIDLITQAKEQLDRELTTLETDYYAFRDSAPLVWRTLTGDGTRGAGESAGANPHEERLAQIDNMRSVIVLENYETKATIDSIEAALQRGANREALNLMIGNKSVTGNNASRMEDKLFPMMLEEQMLLEKYGPDHPQVKERRMRLALTRQHLLGGADEENGQEPTDFYQVYLASLREQIKLGEQKIKTFDDLYDEERDQARLLTKYQIQDETFRSQRDRKNRLYDAVLRRLEEISFVEEVDEPNIVKAEVLHPPGAGRQVEPDFQNIMTVSTMLGLLVGFGLAFVVDSADKRFRTPEDIQRYLALPVVGHIPVIHPNRKLSEAANADPNGPALDSGLVAHFSPQGRTAEAYRAVRTALYFNTQGGGHKVIQVTSPHAGDGKTTLAANLAICVAQSGKRTLLLEADFRRPRCHKMFGLDNMAGVSDAISGEDEIMDVVQETVVKNLSVVTCGTRPDNPSELLTSVAFERLLEVVREKFEFVIIDTPPILAVTDPSVVAPRVDGVLIVMRLTKSARRAALRAREVLDSLGTNVVGIVVNGVGQGSTYGYGRYTSYGQGGYGGYGYGYGYGYGQEYSDKKYYREKNPSAKAGKA